MMGIDVPIVELRYALDQKSVRVFKHSAAQPGTPPHFTATGTAVMMVEFGKCPGVPAGG
jgi:hypothetical protein